MLWVYGQYKYFYSAGIDFKRQNMRSTYVELSQLIANLGSLLNVDTCTSYFLLLTRTIEFYLPCFKPYHAVRLGMRYDLAKIT